MAEDSENHVELLKQMVGEIKALHSRIDMLERENMVMQKSIEDPEALLKRFGWTKFTTPHADETFDPLQRNVPNEASFDGPFAGSGDLFKKSRYDELEEWKAAEQAVNG